MATRIVDLDLASLPEDIPLNGADRVWVVGWRNGIPAGSFLYERNGARSLKRDEVEQHLDAPATAGDRPPPSRSRPSLSVVICTRNRPDRLPIALDALREQRRRDIELVVVDNAPEDERTRRVVEREWPNARYVVEPVPGIGRARNTGARTATGRVVAYTDDDCRPIPTWTEAIADCFTQDPGIGCVTGPILPLELETPAQEAMEERGGFNRGFARQVHTLDDEDGPVWPVQAWRFGAGASMAFSRECLDAVGGFDAALWRSEDLDIFYRAIRTGHVLAFEPGAAVRHRHLPDWDQLRRRMFHWGWGYLTYLDKIVRTDTPKYAERARRERREWLRYQLRDRALPAITGAADLPLGVVLREIAGGAAGYWGYPLARRAAQRRAAA